MDYMDTNDRDRLEWLMRNGYVHREANGLIDYLMDNAEDVVTSHIVDFLISKGFAPAYWRQPIVSSDGLSVEIAAENGLVFVRNGDRQRIDECMTK